MARNIPTVESEQQQHEIVPKLVQDVPYTDVTRIGEFTPSGATDFDTIVPEQREFEPLAVTRLGGTLPWDTESAQLQCGETVTTTSGDLNIRLVYHCICTHTQFKTLQQMRSSPQRIKLVSAAYSGPVSFDQMKFDRVTDANGYIYQDGENGDEPLYKVQLQSKEDKNDSGNNDNNVVP